MATIYVSDNAAGANNGTSWVDAYTSLDNAGVDGAEAGSTIYVDSTHNENPESSTTFNFTGGTLQEPINLISVNTGDNSYIRGAYFQADSAGNADLDIGGFVRWWGFDLESPDMAELDHSSSHAHQYYEDCDLDMGDDTTFPARVIFKDTTFNIADANAEGAFTFVESTYALFQNCSIVHSSNTLIRDAGNSTIIFEGCNLAGSTDNLTNGISASGNQEYIFRGCEMKAGWQPLAGGTISGPGASILVENCATGNITVPALGLNYYGDYYGDISGTLDTYRTNGANDGEQPNAYSWRMQCSTGSVEFSDPLRSPPIVAWTNGSSAITAKLYVAANRTLQNDEFWIEFIGPDEAVTGTARAYVTGTRMSNIQNTPANLTTDASSTWNGAGVSTQHEVSITYTPTIAGVISVRACLANATGLTAYVDPKLEIS